MPTNDPNDLSRGTIIDAARHLSLTARRYADGRATRRDVEEAFSWWKNATDPDTVAATEKELFLSGGHVEPPCKFCGEFVTEARETCRECWGEDL